MPLRLRRGTDAERLTITPAEGELIYTTDYKKLFVGDGETIGGIDIVGGISGDLLANVNLNGYTIQGTGNILVSGNISSTNVLSNGTLTFSGNNVTSSSGFIAVGSGNDIGTANLGTIASPLQVHNWWNEAIEPFNIKTGITNGFFSLITHKQSSRGTIDSPLVVQAGDALTIDRTYGYDGYDYVLSSSIWQGVDPSDTPSPGYVPGAIAFVTEGPMGQNVTAINSRGYLSINRFPVNATEALDVNGNAVISGEVTAAAFKGSVVSEDSTVIVNGTTGDINANLIISESIGTKVLSVAGGGAGAYIENKLVLTQANPTLNILEQYGITNGNNSLISSKCSSRGTLTTQTVIQSGDIICEDRAFGWDGTTYIRSSSIQQGVDGAGTVDPGIVPGVILLTTRGSSGEKIVAIDSLGRLSINKYPTAATAELDVNGSAVISGTVTSTFKGRFVLDDGVTDMVNSTTNQINCDTLLTKSFGAETINVTTGGFIDNKLIIRQADPVQNILEQYGITNGVHSIVNSKCASRGTFNSLQVIQLGDVLSEDRSFGWDGSTYILASSIVQSVDPTGTISANNIPGMIMFMTKGADGEKNVIINSLGHVGINKSFATEALDVNGNAVISGTVTASAFKGTFVADDSTIIIDGITGKVPYSVLDGAPTKLSEFVNDLSESDPTFALSVAAGITGPDVVNWNTAYGWGNHASAGYLTAVPGYIKADVTGSVFADDSTMVVDGLNGNVTGNTVTSNGFVMFGHYDAAGRAALTPANGMVIYNTTVDKFQGFQGGAWINLDDGSAAP